MKATETKYIVFNAAAGLVGLTAVALAARSLLPSSTTPCAERYLTAMTFTLERGGEVLKAADLQSGMGGRDAGVARNLTVERLQDGPVSVAMAVDLPRAPAAGVAAADGNGVSFPWEPRALRGQTGVCLSYRLKLPGDFNTSIGGALPGIRGADDSSAAENGFVVRPVWRSTGQGGAEEVRAERRPVRLEWSGFALPRGRWARVDQELVLNAPKKKDGIYRIWVDGALVVDRRDLELRAGPGMTVSGVAASVFYGGEDAVARAPRDTRIWLSPFEVRWKP
jgi:hypothetical protein